MSEQTSPSTRKRSDLGDAVVARLAEGGPATPYTIGKAINRSAGAVAAASRYLIAEGRIARLSDKPVIFGLPGSKVPASTAKSAKKAGKNKAAERIANLAAMKAEAAEHKALTVAVDGSKVPPPSQPKKVAAARKARKAPPAVATTI